MARVIGLAIVAAGVSITFLPVSSGFPVPGDEPVGTPSFIRMACGTAWQAMFLKDVNLVDTGCAAAAYPHGRGHLPALLR